MGHWCNSDSDLTYFWQSLLMFKFILVHASVHQCGENKKCMNHVALYFQLHDDYNYHHKQWNAPAMNLKVSVDGH